MKKIELTETEVLKLKVEFEKQKDKLQRWVYFPLSTRVVWWDGQSYFLQGYQYLPIVLIEQLGGGYQWGDVPCQFFKDIKFSEDGFTIRLYRKDRIYLIRKDFTEFLKREGIAEPVQIIAKDFDESFLAVLTPPPYKSDRLTPQEIETVLESIGLMVENFKNKEEATDLISRKLF